MLHFYRLLTALLFILLLSLPLSASLRAGDIDLQAIRDGLQPAKAAGAEAERALADYCLSNKNYEKALAHLRACVAFDPALQKDLQPKFDEAAAKLADSEPFFAGETQDAYFELTTQGYKQQAAAYLKTSEIWEKAGFGYRALLAAREAFDLDGDLAAAEDRAKALAKRVEEQDQRLQTVVAAGLQGAAEIPDTGTKLRCYLELPSDYPNGLAYPVVIYFHGAGDSGDNAAQYFRSLRESGGVIMVSASFSWSRTPTTESFGQDEKEALALVDTLLRDWPVDPDKVIFAAHSMGGMMWSQFFTRHADLGKGWFTVNANLGSLSVRKQAKGNATPILLVEGKLDPGRGAAAGAVKKLREANYTQVSLEEPDGVGHNDLHAVSDLILAWQRKHLGNPYYPFD